MMLEVLAVLVILKFLKIVLVSVALQGRTARPLMIGIVWYIASHDACWRGQREKLRC